MFGGIGRTLSSILMAPQEALFGGILGFITNLLGKIFPTEL